MIRVALNHKSTYRYSRSVELGPQVVRLRPAPHARTPICSYSLNVLPANHFLNWQQDPHGNFLARLVFPEPATALELEVDLVAEMTVVNPFDFFLEPDAEEHPFRYAPELRHDLEPYLKVSPPGTELSAWLKTVDHSHPKTMDFLVALNRQIHQQVQYVIRMEPGVQAPETTLSLRSGSCRDSAWLLVQVLRHLGLAARFASGYLIQLKPDIESLDGPSGAAEDFTDLHAWAEVYLPGAGWIGLDPTSGLLAGEGHIPVACTPEPSRAAPVSGTVEDCEVHFNHEMSVRRVHEDPRVTKPYSDSTWSQIVRVGEQVDSQLVASDVRLTMGGEPTFVSVDDMEGDEWKTAAVGPTKKGLASELIHRLRRRFAPGGLLHFGEGKWYPGEPLPRWAITCMWRTDQEPIWKNEALLADVDVAYGFAIEQAEEFTTALTEKLRVSPEHIMLAYEDTLYRLWQDRRIPANERVQREKLASAEDRRQVARELTGDPRKPVGCVLPLTHQWWNAKPRWLSGSWPLRAEEMFLIPGDSPMGLRLPLDTLPPTTTSDITGLPTTPFTSTSPLPTHQEMRRHFSGRARASDSSEEAVQLSDGILRTAMCVEPRDGKLHVFMPPLDRLEDYLELLSAIEETVEQLEMPIILEGYLPPTDYRLRQVKVTPDPGVIEVNIHPANNWPELVSITSGVYEDARQSRLGTEKFDVDGTHAGTGGGNHVVVGGPTPADSPFLRRPDLLRSLIGYWHNHPSLSYLFSNRFVGPTSQAPRVDEGRRDATYELQIAFEQVPPQGNHAPWLVDRIFRHLLVDLTGNTHRAEFCIDKLYSPDSSTGRLGLVEFRAFEMPPHWQMSLTQQLLLRALIARFWDKPYHATLIDWSTSLHDRWMLPHFIEQDIKEVVNETAATGIPLDSAWFAPHFEFRFPHIGEIQVQDVSIELRAAIEPWYVLGEEPAGGQTARYVDSSVERLQVKAAGMSPDRHTITCNGRQVPLHPTGVEGEMVGGVRYRAWQPPSCLHPTIGVDEPLVFDLVDQWQARSLGGCRYHVGHPGGINPGSFPVNAYEAESRRAARFFKFGHTGGSVQPAAEEKNPRFPMTLDLRRNRGTR